MSVPPGWADRIEHMRAEWENLPVPPPFPDRRAIDAQAQDLWDQARRRLDTDPLLVMRVRATAQVLRVLRAWPKHSYRALAELEDDRLIAALTLVVAEQVPEDNVTALADAWQRGVIAGTNYATGATPRLPANPYLTDPEQRETP